MRIILLCLLLLASLNLTACSPTAELTDVPPPTPTEAPTEVPTLTPTNTPLPPTETPVPTATVVPSITPYAGAARIAFTSNRGDNPNEAQIYLINPETKEITLVDTGFDMPILPKWSPDGYMLSFALMDIWNIYTIYADGSGLNQVTDFSSNNADWAPDGKRLIFQSDSQNEPKDTPDIYMIDNTGENLVEIVDTPEIADYSPRLSPVEDKILFVSRNSGKDELWTINTDGSELTRVIGSPEIPVTDGAWSPDGKRSAFAAGGIGKTELLVVDPIVKMSIIQLTNNGASNQSPSWSPDGSQIVFASNTSGNWDLWLINADGTGLTQLIDDEYADLYPDCCPK